MKEKMRFILLLLLMFILQGCKEDVNEPLDINPIEGTWTENYEYILPPWLTIGGEIVTIPGKTELSFTDEQVLIKILPGRRIIDIDSAGVYRSILFSDTLFTGIYSIRNDTLIFCTKGYNDQSEFKYRMDSVKTFKYKYQFLGDILKLSTIPSSTSDSIMVISLSDWLWNGAWGKREGSFSKSN